MCGSMEMIKSLGAKFEDMGFPKARTRSRALCDRKGVRRLILSSPAREGTAAKRWWRGYPQSDALRGSPSVRPSACHLPVPGRNVHHCPATFVAVDGTFVRQLRPNARNLGQAKRDGHAALGGFDAGERDAGDRTGAGLDRTCPAGPGPRRLPRPPPPRPRHRKGRRPLRPAPRHSPRPRRKARRRKPTSSSPRAANPARSSAISRPTSS